MNATYKPATAWLNLGPEFQDNVRAAQFPKALSRYQNLAAARTVGLESLSALDWQRHFHAFEPLPGSLPNPLALRYHGHQFMHYNPDLGDGRGFLFAQLYDQRGRLLDFGTKGSGQTPWSRRGDGRLTLKGAVRELLATSYLEAHGVNTSKTFAIFETGEDLERGDEPSPTRSAVLTRLSHGHVRIGMFQRWAYLNKPNEMKKLVEYCLEHHYPEHKNSSTPVADFFSSVCKQVAITTAQWMAVGFVHGVLNTDNINVTGESFDYGPYRFLPHYDDDFTAAYFDHSQLYAYGQQPRIMVWNLQQLEKSLSLIEPSSEAFSEGYRKFEETFNSLTYTLFLRRLGLDPETPLDISQRITISAIQFLRSQKVPFEHFFFDWHGGESRRAQALASPRAHFYSGERFEVFYSFLIEAESAPIPSEYWQRSEPVHLYIDKIEELWTHIDRSDDWQPLYNHLENIKTIPTTVNVE